MPFGIPPQFEEARRLLASPNEKRLHRLARRSWISVERVMLLVTIPILFAVVFYAFRPFTFESSTTNSNLVTRDCSKNGWSYMDTCFCDAGFTGPDCSRQVPLSAPLISVTENEILDKLAKADQQPILPAKVPKVAIFADAYTPMGILNEGNLNLARELATKGYAVTVFTDKKVNLPMAQVLPVPKLDHQYKPLQLSLGAYHHLSENHYDVIYFDANSNAGYHFLSAQALGSKCIGSRTIVSVTQPDISHFSNVDQTDPNYALVSYLRQKSIEFNERLIFASSSLWADEKSRIPDTIHSSKVTVPITTKLEFGTGFKHPILNFGFVEDTPIQELVFVGDMSEEGGLVQFADAISLLHSTLDKLQVTFMGTLSKIQGVDSVDYIHKRSTEEWNKFSVSILSSPLSALPILKYLTAPRTMRAAVIASRIPNLVIIQELLRSATPVIMSDRPDHVKLLNKDSAILFNENNLGSLADQMKKVVTQGARPPVMNIHEIQSGEKFQLDLFEELIHSEPVCKAQNGMKYSDFRTNMASVPVSILLVHPVKADLGMLQKSVASIEAQAYPKLEVIVVAAEDTKAEETYVSKLAKRWWDLRGWKVFQVTSESHRTLENIALSQASSEYVTIIQSGTVLKPNFMQTMMQATLRGGKDLVLAGVDDYVTHSRQLPLASRLLALTSGDHLNGVFVSTLALLKEAGGYNGNLDAFFIKATLLNKKVEALPESLAWFEDVNSFSAPTNELPIDHVESHVQLLPSNERDMVQKLLKKRHLKEHLQLIARQAEGVVAASTDSSTTDTATTTETTTTTDTSMTTTSATSMTTTSNASMSTTSATSMTTTTDMSMSTTSAASMTTTTVMSMSTTSAASMTTTTDMSMSTTSVMSMSTTSDISMTTSGSFTTTYSGNMSSVSTMTNSMSMSNSTTSRSTYSLSTSVNLNYTSSYSTWCQTTSMSYVPPPKTTTTSTIGGGGGEGGWFPERPSPPAVNPQPTLYVNYRPILPNCDDKNITLDMSPSIGANLTFWYQYSGADSVSQSILMAFNGTRNATVSLPPSFVPALGQTMLKVTVVSNYQLTGTQYNDVKTITIRRINGAPYLKLDAGPLKIKRSLGINAFLSYSFADCGSSNPPSMLIAYRWVMNAIGNSTAIDLAPIAITGITSKNIRINLRNFLPGSYNLSSIFTLNDLPFVTSKTIDIIAGDLNVKIKGGNSFLITNTQDFTFEAMVIDEDAQAFSAYTYMWQRCDANGASCTNMGSTTSTSVLSANTLQSDTNYIIKVTVMDNLVAGRSATFSSYIRTSAQELPLLNVVSFPNSTFIPIRQGIIMNAAVRLGNSVAIGATCSWTMSPNTINTLDLSSVSTNYCYLSIPPNILAFGSSYLFKVTTTVNGASTYSEIQVNTASAPSGGVLSVMNSDPTQIYGNSLSSGNQYSTFTVSTTGWNGGYPPYRYTFGTVEVDDKGNPFDQYFAYQIAEPIRSGVSFPSLPSSVFVIVHDAMNAFSRVTLPVDIRNVDLGIQAQYNKAQNLYNLALNYSTTDPQACIDNLLIAGTFTDISKSQGLTAQTSQQFYTLQSSIAQLMSTCVATRGINAATAAVAVGTMNKIDPRQISQTALDNFINLVSSVASGISVDSQTGQAQSADVRVVSKVASVIDRMLKVPGLAPAVQANLRRLMKRQLTAFQQLRATVQSLGRSAIAGDTCIASGVAQLFVADVISFGSRRVVATGSISGDSPRTVGNFTVSLPNNMTSGCYDVVSVEWNSTESRVAGGASILSKILELKVYPSTGTNSISLSSTHNVNLTVSGFPAPQAGYVAKCIGWTGSAWSNCTSTNAISSTSVSCNCPLYNEFAVQQQLVSNDGGDGGSGSGSSGINTAAAIGGGVAAGVVVVGGAAGYMVYKRRSAA